MQLQVPYQLDNFIGGEFRAPAGKKYIDNINPATAAKYGEIPDSSGQDIEAAVLAAKKAFEAWSTTPAEKRFIILNKIAELIDENNETLALAESLYG
jgi:aminomuconate-semialdehyde/2-hydroxymuconate-6-semialdehyde dehydrogenase